MKSKNYDLVIYVVLVVFIVVLGVYKIVIDNSKKKQKALLEESSSAIVELASNRYKEVSSTDNNIFSLVYKYYKYKEVSTSNDKLNYDGYTPKGGSIIVNMEAEVAFALYNDYYCAIKDYDGEIAISVKDGSGCDLEKVYYEDESGASKPDVSGNIIAVMYQDGNWIKADTYQKWYDYKQQWWANAVLVDQEVRAKYLYSTPGTIVKDDDILVHLVWVPKYKYQIFNSYSNEISETSIEIVFQSSNETESNKLSNEQWITHPAFTFNGEELDGIWVAKFETSGTKDEPLVKPNKEALNSLTLSEQFDASSVFDDLNTYGIMKKNYVHMMKNTEWGAVLYLSQSKYGIYGIGETMMGNNSLSYITGCASDDSLSPSTLECQNEYNTEIGVKASTTGNIYGIYDMAGGLAEAVMAYTKTTDDNNLSGFTEAPDETYYDLYQSGEESDTKEAYNRKIYGDGTGEVNNWYGCTSYMITSKKPFFIRGGSSINPNIFSFDIYNGENRSDIGFRIVMS
ncbi:MAG: hypothetical protein PHE54_05375 [Bacilli bacterium]|nr:hypothetical protein [Bacilli bacterium]